MLAFRTGGKHMLKALIATAIGFAAVPTDAADWYRVGHTNHSAIYTDAESVSREGEDLQVWEFAVMPAAAPGAWGMVAAKSRLAIRCQDRSYRRLQHISYLRNGTTRSVPGPENVTRQIAPPGSIVENLILLHCGQPHRAIRLIGISPEDDERRLIR